MAEVRDIVIIVVIAVVILIAFVIGERFGMSSLDCSMCVCKAVIP